MVDILMWTLGLAWKVLVVYAGFMAIRYVLRNGKGLTRDILETLGVATRVGCLKARRALAEKLSKDEKDEADDEDNDDPRGKRVEGYVK